MKEKVSERKNPSSYSYVYTIVTINPNFCTFYFYNSTMNFSHLYTHVWKRNLIGSFVSEH